MLRLAHVRMLSAAAIAAVVIASRGAAMESENLPFCYHACTQGAGAVCPNQAEIDAMCSESGCSVGGCAANWGNCPGGYIVQCNEEAN